MRPLFHPSVKEITVEGILYALSDPVRVRIFAGIRKAESAKTCACFLKIDDRNIPKATLSQHFKILREAGLIRSERCGVEMHNTTRCDEIRPRFGKMVASILEAYGEQTGKRVGTKRKR
ncbi:MAG: helix-turn-helix domain-containing protein [Bdellovibrionota bacterium]